MIFLIENRIRVIAPTEDLTTWCKKWLDIPNPEYAKKKRMGFSTYRTPAIISLWEKSGDEILVPYGCLEHLMQDFPDGTDNLWLDGTVPEQYQVTNPKIPLYEYQVSPVEEMLRHHCGILQAPAGSGKTQMGLAIIQKRGLRALWLTHTKDLLKQSRERAEMYGWTGLGTITEGKVDIGTHVTFATVQTMANMDLTIYRNMWDIIIVDECHRAVSTPTSVTMFGKVLNNLKAQYKYGLSATVHRADGLIRCTYALIGEVAAIVPKSAVEKTVMPVTIRPRETGVRVTNDCLMPDGTLNYQRTVKMLTEDEDRNSLIVDDIVKEYYAGPSCLILSDRVHHLQRLMNLTKERLEEDDAVLIDGKMSTGKKKQYREQAIEHMRIGEKRILFATYALAKEGLDIPRLDRLFLVTPHKDYAVITQSIGRIARRYDGKDSAVCYDYVDSIRSLVQAYKRRCSTYRKQDCIIEEES